MNLLEKQVIASLRVYYERGQKVIEHLSSGDTDKALQLLRLRKAAFHNFRVAEERLSSEPGTVLQTGALSDLFAKIDQQDAWLIQAFRSETRRSGKILKGLVKEKKKIKNYKAVKNRAGSFQRSV